MMLAPLRLAFVALSFILCLHLWGTVCDAAPPYVPGGAPGLPRRFPAGIRQPPPRPPKPKGLPVPSSPKGPPRPPKPGKKEVIYTTPVISQTGATSKSGQKGQGSEKTDYAEIDPIKTKQHNKQGDHIGAIERDGKLYGGDGKLLPTTRNPDNPKSRWWQKTGNYWYEHRISPGGKEQRRKEPFTPSEAPKSRLSGGEGNKDTVRPASPEIDPIKTKQHNKQGDPIGAIERDGKLYGGDGKPLPTTRNPNNPKSRWWQKTGNYWYRYRVGKGGKEQRRKEPFTLSEAPKSRLSGGEGNKDTR
ncbi:hypothetical protein CDD83_4114 [Cordyceps sp. RAO-2017]|nr:hypothetical protein CDD83_4114 [Cordyceps sp. RAO-2017]